MKSKRPSKREMRALCGEIHPEDGVDPRAFFRRRPSHRKPNRKVHQLCRQVAEALAYALDSTGDDVLRCLQVAAVEPAPDAARLLVTVQPFLRESALTPALILEHLGRLAGRLRCEVAAAITRKRAPELVFRVAVTGAEATP